MKLTNLVEKKYLDSDQRPEAIALTPSQAQVSKNSEAGFTFSGVLGAIKGDRLAQYVGFTGVELTFEPIVVQELPLILRSLRVNNISSNQKEITFTFQVINQDKQRFAFENTINLEKNDQIIVENYEPRFTGTWRGKYQSEIKLKPVDKICGLTVFLRRSQNNPSDINPIKINFNLSFEKTML